MYVSIFVGEVCAGRVWVLEVSIPELSVSRAAGEGPRRMELKWSCGLGCFPVQRLRVLGDSSLGHTLPTALFAQGDSTLT